MRRSAVVALLAAPLLSLALAGRGVADPYQEARSVYLSGDFDNAFRMYKTLAEQGNADAQFNLALMYEDGEGVAADPAEAAKWYEKAADQDFAPAEFNLGVMYEDGEGVPQDNVAAYMWLDLAASRFDIAELRDEAGRHRDTVASKMNADQVAEAKRRVRAKAPKRGI